MQKKSLFTAMLVMSMATVAFADANDSLNPQQGSSAQNNATQDQPKTAIVDDAGNLKMAPSTGTSSAGTTSNAQNSQVLDAQSLIKNLPPDVQQQIMQLPADQRAEVLQKLQGAQSQIQQQLQQQTQQKARLQAQPVVPPPAPPPANTDPALSSSDSSDNSSTNNVSPGTTSSTASSADGDMMAPSAPGQ